MGFELTSEQVQLGVELKKWWKNRVNQIYVYSGKAGTGKTTVVRYFLEEIGLTNDDIVCCALSGKAVTVLSAHGLPAKTIHSLIYTPMMVDVLNEDGTPMMKPNGEVKKKLQFVKKHYLDKAYKLIVVDELSMVNDELMADLMSFDVPIIGMGDLNQLPPIFGISSYMLKPNFFLTKIMRQSEGNPIVYLANNVLERKPFVEGHYGKSEVRRSIPLDERLWLDYDIALCAKNSTRDLFNNGIRKEILGIQTNEPVPGDRLICRQNDWSRSIQGMYLTNGTAGSIYDIDEERTTKNKLILDFVPDFNMEEAFLNVEVDHKYMTSNYLERKEAGLTQYVKFEYAYMITTHLSQGSQYPSVLYLDEQFSWDRETQAKLRYTAITRAMDRISIVLSTNFLNPWRYILS